jgi:hypothetical protein
MLAGEARPAGAGGGDFYYLHVGLSCALCCLPMGLIFIHSDQIELLQFTARVQAEQHKFCHGVNCSLEDVREREMA